MARQLSVVDETQAPPAAPPAPTVPGERTIRIPVSGMTCAACQARMQRTLQRQPGVVDAGVNLMMHDATVRYSPGAVSPEQLVAAIRDTGSCSEEVVFPDFGIRKFLPTGQKTTIEVTPPKAGKYAFTCGMSMLRGTLVAET